MICGLINFNNDIDETIIQAIKGKSFQNAHPIIPAEENPKITILKMFKTFLRCAKINIQYK